LGDLHLIDGTTTVTVMVSGRLGIHPAIPRN
jgi:hypothetical protein